MKPSECIIGLQSGVFDTALHRLYGKNIGMQRVRYQQAIENFQKLYPNREDICIFSAPGRTEIGGNHTDHQHGCVLAAAVNLDVIGVVAFHEERVIRLQSKGYQQDYVELDDLTIHSREKGTSAALIRGMAAQFHEMHVEVSGFDAYTTSDVLRGSGLSSSAAFEVLIGTIIDQHDNGGKVGPVGIAKMGQYAENQYFGKQSGLMDQMVCSVGGFVFIDFADLMNPEIVKHTCDFAEADLQLCITDTKGSHEDLTDDYVSVPSEMNLIAAQFGKSYLREVNEFKFYTDIPQLRTVCSDRAILRAAHFFSENRRAAQEADALERRDFTEFLQLVRESGDSSARLLQNLYSTRKPSEQGIPLALMMSEKVLKGNGACRVHGGGFAGTIQAFVPREQIGTYCAEMNRLFGDGSCYQLQIRSVGGIQIV